ncbi:MAG: threonylcarbamoyl-AMP synthase [Oscillospiraceae bacterium]|nr:threonylcarbamoyl-AMP synthase [Oscillospiraceae bacterium]
MKTLMLTPCESDIKKAAAILKEGGLVAMPTETVYGLAGNAFDAGSSAAIYAAKGRPSDNPLIVHICEVSAVATIAKAVPDNAARLFDAFWPGPLTVILPKRDIIPYATSGGLDTVGIRFPANKTAQALIRECGFPLAAPSANLSGHPSPTTAQHVKNDLDGRIAAIIDGGICAVGVESTVVSVDEAGHVTLLRPGFVSLEELRDTVGWENVSMARGVVEHIGDGEKVLSPGMKYRHYAPDAHVVIVEGSREEYVSFVNARRDENICAMCFGDEQGIGVPRVPYGITPAEQAHSLFDVLRSLDDISADTVYVRCPEKDGLGLAVYNRLLRAAGFETVRC